MPAALIRFYHTSAVRPSLQ